MPSTIHVEVLRQSTPDATARTEKVRHPLSPQHEHHLRAGRDRAQPHHRRRRAHHPHHLRLQLPGRDLRSCAMLINGRARMACSTLVDTLLKEHPGQPIRLAPLSKFPVVRDLAVDRAVLFENLKVVKAWVPIDGTYDLGPGPRQSSPDRRRPATRSPTASPAPSAWRSAPNSARAPTSSARPPSPRPSLFNINPTGSVLKADRLRALAGDGGIQECGFAQNCVEACPKQLPLTESISITGREAMLQQLKDLFTR